MNGIMFTQPNFLLTIEEKKWNTRRLALLKNGVYIPKYKVGEKVYLKEPYCTGGITAFGQIILYYPYTNEEGEALDLSRDHVAKLLKQESASKSGYCNKMFMPEWAARYYVIMNSVELQRLQDISDEDCIAEGIIEERPEFYECEPGPPKYGFPEIVTELRTVLADELYGTPREAYAAEIDMIHGRGTWESNPYVYSYHYELIREKKVI